MILPTKGVAADTALISVGAEILRHLDGPKTVSRLWDDVRTSPLPHPNVTFDWFTLALDLLYTVGAVEYTAGRIARPYPREKSA